MTYPTKAREEAEAFPKSALQESETTIKLKKGLRDMDRTGKTGVFFIGASGYIATAVIAGALAMRKGLCDRAGMVTELPAFSSLGLIGPEEMVFGGWDVRPSSPLESAREYFRSSLLPSEMLRDIEDGLMEAAPEICMGVATNCGKAIETIACRESSCKQTLSAQVKKLRKDLRGFRERNSLECVVVVNLASTEPPLEHSPSHETAEAFEKCIEEDRQDEVRASSLYSYASVMEGCPYLNFTPSNAALIPAIVKLAEEKGVPIMGDDGKTGETLVKSALLPMFLYRNLEVLSWEGFNILGNMDGRILNDPENKESKIITKDAILGKVLGYSPHSKVHIHYVPSLDDQKTAWNFIHFKGFLGAKMSLQFVWQGYDSVLAAPLVLDLVRLSELSRRRGEGGLMRHLASFFKAPQGVDEHRFYEQAGMLFSYAASADIKGAHT
ncbi:myo-inositol-1-phosphate synthase [uncultured bacterium]|nr:myo-inositol-1-phosphate synthase [uncultured bacterium]